MSTLICVVAILSTAAAALWAGHEAQVSAWTARFDVLSIDSYRLFITFIQIISFFISTINASLLVINTWSSLCNFYRSLLWSVLFDSTVIIDCIDSTYRLLISLIQIISYFVPTINASLLVMNTWYNFRNFYRCPLWSVSLTAILFAAAAAALWAGQETESGRFISIVYRLYTNHFLRWTDY
jgi:hypothetical protein